MLLRHGRGDTKVPVRCPREVPPSHRLERHYRTLSFRVAPPRLNTTFAALDTHRRTLGPAIPLAYYGAAPGRLDGNRRAEPLRLPPPEPTARERLKTDRGRARALEPHFP